jgi:hypothetical protein
VDYLYCVQGRQPTLDAMRASLASGDGLVPCPPLSDSRHWMVSVVPKPGSRVWVLWIGRKQHTGIRDTLEVLVAGRLVRSPAPDDFCAVLWSRADCVRQGRTPHRDLGTTFLRLEAVRLAKADGPAVAGQFQRGFNTPTTLDHARLSELLPLP